MYGTAVSFILKRIYFVPRFTVGEQRHKGKANYNWYIHTMKGMVIVHKVAVTTLITLAYSGWLSNSEAMLTQVVAEGVAVAHSVISKIVSPSGEKLAKPLYFKNTKTISGITIKRKKATRGTRL